MKKDESAERKRARWRRYYWEKKRKDRKDLKETLRVLGQMEDFK